MFLYTYIPIEVVVGILLRWSELPPDGARRTCGCTVAVHGQTCQRQSSVIFSPVYVEVSESRFKDMARCGHKDMARPRGKKRSR